MGRTRLQLTAQLPLSQLVPCENAKITSDKEFTFTPPLSFSHSLCNIEYQLCQDFLSQLQEIRGSASWTECIVHCEEDAFRCILGASSASALHRALANQDWQPGGAACLVPGGMNLVLTPRNPSINNLVWINQTLL